ncbi:MAG: T9SS type A sorting domain-containing protein [Bacteroidetes bacterium]|nr:T9SS type A sorting domain-containing protein [Bacteroidota bacterium]
MTNWEWTCGAQSFNSTPPGGGSWCIKVAGGNLQGCFPGYAYQKLPAITNGQTFVLSGWAYAEISQPIGMFFGVVNNGVLTTQAGATTNSASWSGLTSQSNFSLGPDDTAAVILYGGTTTGPVQGYGYFDLVTLSPVTGVSHAEAIQNMQLFPVPMNDQLHVEFQNNQLSEFLLYDLGARKLEHHYFLNSITINTQSLAKGVYLYQLKNRNGSVKNGKIVKK